MGTFTAFHSSTKVTLRDFGEPNGEPRRANACEPVRTPANGKSSVRAQLRTPANPCEHGKATPQFSGLNLDLRFLGTGTTLRERVVQSTEWIGVLFNQLRRLEASAASALVVRIWPNSWATGWARSKCSKT
jgi:hypothetical protein